MSTRRTMPGGWAKKRRGPCRWCGGEVPRGRFTFCGPECVHQWKLRTDPAYLRAQVFLRDHGVCALCGVDTEALRKDKRKLDYAARRQFEKDWSGRRHLWDADHILPVAAGGGECDLSNMRTLCLKCHRTRHKRDTPNASPTEEVPMPGKKPHKPRNMDHAGMHGVRQQAGHGRKSAGQTEGQFARDGKGRPGQYTNAGNPPLIKK